MWQLQLFNKILIKLKKDKLIKNESYYDKEYIMTQAI